MQAEIQFYELLKEPGFTLLKSSSFKVRHAKYMLFEYEMILSHLVFLNLFEPLKMFKRLVFSLSPLMYAALS